MPAFVITDVEITDPSLYGQFLERVTGTVEDNGAGSWRAVARWRPYWVIGRPSASPSLNSTTSSRSAGGWTRRSSRRSTTFVQGPPTSTWW